MSSTEDWNIPPIEKSLKFDVTNFPSFDKRYFKAYHTKKSDIPSDDEATEVGPQLVLVHSNRLCLVCLSPEHPVVKGGHTIKKVDMAKIPPNGVWVTLFPQMLHQG